jgi:exodeoxyribonuclease VII large subunit
VPVISAVGHEVDVTLCDLVADVRAPTPSVAAELAVPEARALLRALEATTARLVECEARGRRRLEQQLEGFLTRYGLRAVRDRIAEGAQTRDELVERLCRAVRRRAQSAGEALGARAARLEALSPLATLGRGYALVERLPDGTLVRSAEQLAPGNDVRLRFSRGEALARVVRTRGGAAESGTRQASDGRRAGLGAPGPEAVLGTRARQRRAPLPDDGQLSFDT